MNYNKRFDGNKQEVLDYAKRFGIHKTMDRYGARDYVCFGKWLTENAVDITHSDFGIPSLDGEPSVFRQFFNTLADWIEAERVEKRNLKQELQKLNSQVEYLRGQQGFNVEKELVSAMKLLEPDD